MTRPSWDQYFLLLAQVTSLRASCKKAKHGCVLVKDNRILAAGYNGAPSGRPSCMEVGCNEIEGHCLRCRHAEENAILSALEVVGNLDGVTAYVTGTPCTHCGTRLIQEGVERVVYAKPYGKSNSPNLFDMAGVKHELLPLEIPFNMDGASYTAKATAPNTARTGLHQKYIITKADGSPIPTDADYFVLRLDRDEAGRQAMLVYAELIKESNPELAEGIRSRVGMWGAGFLTARTVSTVDRLVPKNHGVFLSYDTYEARAALRLYADMIEGSHPEFSWMMKQRLQPLTQADAEERLFRKANAIQTNVPLLNIPEEAK